VLQVEIDKLEQFINRFGAKASKATAAQSKMKALDKLKAVAVEVRGGQAAGGAAWPTPTLCMQRSRPPPPPFPLAPRAASRSAAGAEPGRPPF
jgi:hypothetical protein